VDRSVQGPEYEEREFNMVTNVPRTLTRARGAAAKKKLGLVMWIA
jgi:hypothetical protein